ncbi:CRISPR-associated protein Cas4 [Nostoc sp. CENA67]|uniref:CRISPR-associated exonuclease Cas4 n=1 Tax=Amazonocrinis nigriterrae CENA67 TaxID=2794033 RepID=A0A8J7LCR0_9NOST|nr:CRISPR-associated protein Cas4 [Amazonocrinis nigriterrae]MBH8564951.1 CRISPR-associated protein Cas4 [Amazonocrinis nigriterrae CENA67]
MNEQYYLPLAYLNAWEYCPRRFFLEYELGENADNEHMIIGRHLHRNVDDEGKYVEGDKVIYRHQWVWCDRLLINGIIDAVEEKDNQLIPLEFKKGRMANHLNDHFQLCGAALCLEERTGGFIPYGEIFYYANRRRERVNFTPALRQATEQAIASARAAIGQKMPPPIDHPKKCNDCSLQKICLPKEVKKLRLEV